MATVKIYKIICTKAYMASEQGARYSLSPWGNNSQYYEGYDNGGREYTLPAGYQAAMSNGGTMEIYNSSGERCALGMHSSGRPQILDNFQSSPVLKEIE